MAYASSLPLLPVILLLRMAGIAWKRRGHFGQFLKVFPFAVMLVTIWSMGEGVGYMTNLAFQ